ncbi:MULTISPECIES: protein-methionine-sulfoxide reductase catalytic subunit MsrP [unclassified Campylobacter]|uniref:protein-methionine-sulfoxide reductase catalytic subunit MsrP n=1 Tax=unclassified Campylobacter TaxID=2593542 RepID=UPI001237BA57|nr:MULTISPECIES: protein-methionine-sulfoxide reductase catalytic subunit MsrP [unclassified Campylobacter]KAA6225911.1 protein-methionine-sulfoxide reductase catalytic subunit MsrP [Campylobacter sp. LR196d]KAA6226522.1 protein-methionine-sulfoxide reductase catalytic subunit MsrP [Campylobacter sp. LR286c]KAA6226992.1 protein-methionine-sulfoxide reductase catalytic subunit MsrP [Campylobacter sp. LR185c]KAA6230025.1 protein-methionine-sulfoxide reductase catalytic subunit MsrP [Campylobacter
MEITPHDLYKKRREFLKLGAGTLLSTTLLSTKLQALNFLKDDKTSLKLSDESLVNNHINFYEFSTNKKRAVALSNSFNTNGWMVDIGGECEKPIRLSMDDFIKFPLEERIYRFRCVETWSMVVPWVGFELRHLIDKVKPTSKAKFIKFTTLFDKSKFEDQAAFFPVLEYPYVEGLRMDEALNPLSILAVGLYKQPLKASNGAPIRLVVPWKYGFKSIKSIVKIEFTQTQPKSTWELYNPNEYGFYANVNPQVSHPRWSQAYERELGSFFTKPTLLFNGYEKEVSHLYANLDLRKNF